MSDLTRLLPRFALVAALFSRVAMLHAQPLGTAFTYQGRLAISGAPANGAHDFEFRLFDSATLGSPVGGAVTLPAVAVSGGHFTVVLDFGGSAFDGQRRWLEIRVQPAGGGAYTTLSPRQELTASPNALWSMKAEDAQTLGGVASSGYALSGEIVSIIHGGTGTTTAAGARSALQAAASGSNSDITSLTGLTTPLSVGQGGTGAVTATGALSSLNAQTRVTGTCAVGMFVRAVNADGTVVCGTDADTNSGGTVTSITTGVGLTGGPIATAGILSIAPGGVTSSLIASGSVGFAQINPSQVQARLASTCPSGTYLRGVNFDGSTVCDIFNLAPMISTVDSSVGDVGRFTSMTISGDGLGLISYYDVTNGNLKVAHCANTACTGFAIATLDSTGDVGQFTSIAIGADGLGLISYYDATNQDLKVGHCLNAACSALAPSPAILDSTGNVGQYASITIGADGLGLISYYDATNQDLKVAHCSNTACTASTNSTLVSTGNVGFRTSITSGADGLGLITFHKALSATEDGLVLAHCSNTGCTASTNSALAGAAGSNAITIGADGLGLIGFHNATLQSLAVTHCSDTACDASSGAVLDNAGQVGASPSITIGADGLGLISYYDITNRGLKVAHCSNSACTASMNTMLDLKGNVGSYSSITIGADGLPLISYYDSTDGNLKVVKCNTLTCAQ